MLELTYVEHIERTRKAILRRIEQAREHGAYLGTAETIQTGLLRNVEVSGEDEASVRRLIDAERMG